MSSVTNRDIGRRVVLRHRLPPDETLGADAPTVTDVLGILEQLDGQHVVVRRADGRAVRVDQAAVLALKVVPPRPVPRRDMRSLEQAAALGWQAVEQEDLGGWLLRAADGFTKRANSASTLQEPPAVPGAVAEVVKWYDARGLPPLIHVVPRITPNLDAVLERQGWTSIGQSIVLSTPVQRLLEAAQREDQAAGQPSVALEPEPSSAWLSAYFGDDQQTPAARRVLGEAPGAALGFVTLGDDEVLAIGRGAVSRDSAGRRWLGLTALHVEPRARGQRLAVSVVSALARWALQHQADEAFVQVVESNQAALRLYDRLGFVEHHRYHYRRRGA